ncbi:MAG: fused NADH-quinone oxidoreductase subunit E/endonuclease, partial [Jannaschia sp.]
EMLDQFRAGEVPVPGSQSGRFAAEPLGGVTSLADYAEKRDNAQNASVALATGIGDTIKRIDGTEVPLVAPWGRASGSGSDPKLAKRDPMLGPTGPDGKQGGRTAGEKDAPRERGAASDGVAEVPGSDAKTKAKPKRGTVAPESKSPDAESTAPDAAGQDAAVGTRPAARDAPKDGSADNLKAIKGIGPKLEKLCNSMGFYYFEQIADWSADEIAWVDSNLEGFKGRVTRDEWVKQARVLAEGGETDFSARVKKGDVT